jgi:hypothetical protein
MYNVQAFFLGVGATYLVSLLTLLLAINIVPKRLKMR